MEGFITRRLASSSLQGELAKLPLPMGELAKLPLPFQRASALASQNVVERGEEGYTAGKPSSRASTSAPDRRGGVNDYWSRLQGIGNPYFCWLLHKSLL